MRVKHWLLAACASGLSGCAALVMVPTLLLSSYDDAEVSSSCAGMAPPAGAEVAPVDPADLAAVQDNNAAIIVAVGEQMKIPPQGIVIALATASQESGLRMLANDGTGKGLRPEQKDVSRSLNYPHEGVGNDHGSVNMFQQQYPWWGTLDELMDPRQAASKFYTALLKVPGWDAMAVTDAAQAVQGSAFPSAYADDEPIARGLYAKHQGASAGAPPLPQGPAVAAAAVDGRVLCGSGKAKDCPATNDPAEAGLTPDALRVMRCLIAEFGPRRWANVGPRPASVDRDHQEGRAVDAMIDDYRSPAGRALGDQIAAWLIGHADELGVRYIIWNERIWERGAVGAPGAWGPYTHPDGSTSDTLAHRDHVHISVFGNAAGTGTGGGEHRGDGVRLPIDEGRYVITSMYGPRWGTFHAGLDFGAPSGTPIHAVIGGTVTQAGDAGDGYGHCVRIRDGDTEILYAHQVNGSIKVAVGDQIQPGALIGGVGSTGDSTGPHLHLEIRVNGRATDPMPWLAGMGLTPTTQQ